MHPTIDLNDLANALRILLIVAGVVWIAYAWLRRVEYRRAVLGLVGLVIADVMAHAFADWAQRPDSGIPTDFAVYTVMLTLAAISGFGAAYFFARRWGIATNVFLDGAILVTLAGIVGARAYHVAMRWDYYRANPDDILNLAQGGLGMRGALILGLIALVIYARVRHLALGQLLDAGAVGLALGQALGWLGAHYAGVNYGIVSDSVWAVELADIYGLVEPRYPVQVWASAFFAVLFLALALSAWRMRGLAGGLFLAYLLAASLGGFASGFIRGDETLYVGDWRADQLVDVDWVAVALIAMGARLMRSQQKVEPIMRNS
jgi:phosphatidylglycerol:prolipoprotein diacylglycerol transferase